MSFKVAVMRIWTTKSVENVVGDDTRRGLTTKRGHFVVQSSSEETLDDKKRGKRNRRVLEELVGSKNGRNCRWRVQGE